MSAQKTDQLEVVGWNIELLRVTICGQHRIKARLQIDYCSHVVYNNGRIDCAIQFEIKAFNIWLQCTQKLYQFAMIVEDKR